jgi:glutamate carboxypeptidase
MLTAVQRQSLPVASTETLLEGIRRLVAIESQTADPTGVNKCVTLCAEEFRAMGADVERVPGVDGKGDHLMATIPGLANGPGVLVLCHLDTVHPKGTLATDLPFRIDGDRAYGPGIYDMKGGVYIALAAAREIVREGKRPPLSIRFLIVSDEEIGSPTSQSLIEAQGKQAKFVLVTEPARDGGKIVTSRKGVSRYELTAHGRPAHAGARHADGRSAILEMAHQILAIEGLTDYKRGITTCVGQIKGGTADNVIPQKCHIAIDVRATTYEDAMEVDRFLRALKTKNPDVRLEITGGLNRPPFEQSAQSKALFDHAKTVAKEIGIDLVGISTGGGSDGNFTAKYTPTLDGLGVDGHGAHTLEEHLLVSSLMPRMRLQKRLFETLS